MARSICASALGSFAGRTCPFSSSSESWAPPQPPSHPALIAAGAIITALTSFAALCWKAWRRGAPLSKPETAVLGFITVHRPIKEADLLAKMHGTLDLKDDDVTDAIKTLPQVGLRDGSIVSLIRKDAADQWRPEMN